MLQLRQKVLAKAPSTHEPKADTTGPPFDPFQSAGADGYYDVSQPRGRR